MRGKLSGGTSQDGGTVRGQPCKQLVPPGDFISIGGELNEKLANGSGGPVHRGGHGVWGVRWDPLCGVQRCECVSGSGDARGGPTLGVGLRRESKGDDGSGGRGALLALQRVVTPRIPAGHREFQWYNRKARYARAGQRT